MTQTYDAGACVYFYFGFNSTGMTDPAHVYEEIESKARKNIKCEGRSCRFFFTWFITDSFAGDEILSSGGTISHHHGVGKLRKKWYPQSISSVGLGLFNATKNELDPKNIFAVGNLANDTSSIAKL